MSARSRKIRSDLTTLLKDLHAISPAVENRSHDEGQRSGPKNWELFGPPLVLIDENNGREFLRRWRVLQSPLFSIFVHRMQVPDPGTDLHDHPWSFLSLVLKGGYTEVVAPARRSRVTSQVVRIRRRWSVAGIRLDQCHRVRNLHDDATWTLVVTGPTRRRWGFFVDGVWQDWEHEYDYARRYPSVSPEKRQRYWQEAVDPPPRHGSIPLR